MTVNVYRCDLFSQPLQNKRNIQLYYIYKYSVIQLIAKPSVLL